MTTQEATQDIANRITAAAEFIGNMAELDPATVARAMDQTNTPQLVDLLDELVTAIEFIQESDAEDEAYEQSQNFNPPTSFPYYPYAWTEQMRAFLLGAQKEFAGSEEWCEWLVESTEAICQSWNCKEKAVTPWHLLVTLVQGVADGFEPWFEGVVVANQFMERINAAVAEWEVGEEWFTALSRGEK